jgi:hypothetical protein
MLQLYRCGLSYRQIRRMVAKGYLHPLYYGVYVVGHANASERGRLRGATLTCGNDAFLSHRTAAALLGLRRTNPYAIEVTIPGPGDVKRPPLTVHRTRHVPVRDELRMTNGLRHSSFARVIVELAARETDAELLRLVEEGVRRRLFRIDKVEAALARHARSPGVGRLARPLAHYLDTSDRKSPLEREFDRELARRPHLPAPERNVRLVAGGVNWELDCLWREQGVVLELDGRPFHVIERDFEKDKLKDMKLAGAGLVVVRVTTQRFERDTDGVFADIDAVLERRRAA